MVICDDNQNAELVLPGELAAHNMSPNSLSMQKTTKDASMSEDKMANNGSILL